MNGVLDELRPTGAASGVDGFDSLIVALDLVEGGGDRALPTAGALARLGGVPLELLTVSSPNLVEDVDAYELERRARATGWALTDYTILHDDSPAAAIASYVADRPDSLLVMATSAKRALTGLFLGSVSEDLLSLVARPVLLVGPRVGPVSHTIHPTLVACVDGSGDGEKAVPAIGRWTHTFAGGQPWVVEVVTRRPPAARSDADATSHVRTYARLLADRGVQASCEVAHGEQPDLALVEFGNRLCDPVFVVASERWTDGRVHWHSTTRSLVQRADRPVLVVPA